MLTFAALSLSQSREAGRRDPSRFCAAANDTLAAWNSAIE